MKFEFGNGVKTTEPKSQTNHDRPEKRMSMKNFGTIINMNNLDLKKMLQGKLAGVKAIKEEGNNSFN